MLAIAFTIAGGTLELLGLWLVWRDIQRDRRHAGGLLRPTKQRPRPQRHYAHRFSPPGPSIWGSPESGERQLRRLEEDLGKLAAALGNALTDVRKLLDDTVGRAVDGLEAEINDRDNQLRDILRDVLAGSVRDRQIGAALLAIGIVFAVAGSMIGTLA